VVGRREEAGTCSHSCYAELSRPKGTQERRVEDQLQVRRDLFLANSPVVSRLCRQVPTNCSQCDPRRCGTDHQELDFQLRLPYRDVGGHRQAKRVQDEGGRDRSTDDRTTMA